MKQAIVELFITDEIKNKLYTKDILKGCEKCSYGVIDDEICDCCLQNILLLILDIPKRYDIEFNISSSLKKQIDLKKDFIVLTGENKYVKLVGFYLAKEFIKHDNLVKYVSSKEIITPEDITALNKADVILFEDIYKKKSDLYYKDCLLKRIDNNRKVIFLNGTELVEFDDDFIQIDIDSSDIKLNKER